MPLSPYKTVFFDVGNTLLRVHPSVGDVYAQYARPHGFEGTAEDLNIRFANAWKAIGGMESLGTQRGDEVERKFWYGLVRQVFDEIGGLDRFDAYFEAIYEAFRSGDHWRIYDDVTESRLLENLKERGVILGVISNWDSRLEEILTAIGLARHFDFILASTVVGSAKPDRRIFEEALERSGVHAGEACHIGDEPNADVEGARSVGIEPILIDRKGRHSRPDVKTISSFLELV